MGGSFCGFQHEKARLVWPGSLFLLGSCSICPYLLPKFTASGSAVSLRLPDCVCRHAGEDGAQLGLLGAEIISRLPGWPCRVR